MTGLGIDPELVTWMALRRVAAGRVLRLAAGSFVDGGRPVPGYIAEAFTTLTAAGLVDEHDEPDQPAHRLVLTDTGATDYAQLSKRHRAGLSAPAPEFPHPPAPGSQPDPLMRTRWARCPVDGRLHAAEPADALLAATRGYLECLCGQRLPADVPLVDGPSGALCPPCVVGVTSETENPGRFGGWAL